MDDSQKFTPIPAPVSGTWREFRIQVLPFLFFGLVFFLTFQLWRDLAPGTRIAGISEGLRSIVSNPRTGILKELNVQPYQWVEAGTPLLIIQPQDPNAQLNVLQSELQLSRLLMEPTTA